MSFVVIAFYIEWDAELSFDCVKFDYVFSGLIQKNNETKLNFGSLMEACRMEFQRQSFTVHFIFHLLA